MLIKYVRPNNKKFVDQAKISEEDVPNVAKYEQDDLQDQTKMMKGNKTLIAELEKQRTKHKPSKRKVWNS